jgi:hypothetical protein
LIVTDDRVARFIAERLGFAPCPPFTVMGVEQDGKIRAAVLFNMFEGCDVHITAAGTGWNREFLTAIGDYAYNQLGCERVTFKTEQPKVVEYTKRLGGEVEGVLRNHFGQGRNAFIIGVLKDEWLTNRKK